MVSTNSTTSPNSCLLEEAVVDWPCLSSGRGDIEKMRQMEEKILFLTKNLHDLQSTLRTLNDRFQQGVLRPGGGGGSAGGAGAGGSSGGRNLADAAQPEIKETINSIQTKLDQLDNRTQASFNIRTCFLLNDSTHIVGGTNVQTADVFSLSGSRQDAGEHQQSPGERERNAVWRSGTWR